MKKCTDKEQDTCNVEKHSCIGCFYNEEEWKDIEGYKRNISSK